MFHSLFPAVPLKIKRNIAVLSRASTPRLKLAFMDAVKQTGDSDCGLYAIANATAICAAQHPTLLEYDQQMMRKHLMQCLDNGFLTPFPSKKRRKTVSAPSFEEVEVFCFCREPERGRMIQCVQCTEWFHSQCVMVHRNHWKKRKSWYCPRCRV